jgi:hypothetical protein
VYPITPALVDPGGKLGNYAVTANNGSLTIVAAGVNHAPSFVKGSNQTILNRSQRYHDVPGWATAISAGSPDESWQTLDFETATNNGSLFFLQNGVNGMPQIDPTTGALSYNLSGATGSATVTVWLHDNGGTANGGADTSAPVTFTISVVTLSGKSPPYVAQQAWADNSSVESVSTNLHVLGVDSFYDESQLIYTWSVLSCPIGVGVSFSQNASNAAKDTTAVFTAPGNYTFTVTITNPDEYSVTSDLPLAVQDTVSSILLSPIAGVKFRDTVKFRGHNI